MHGFIPFVILEKLSVVVPEYSKNPLLFFCLHDRNYTNHIKVRLLEAIFQYCDALFSFIFVFPLLAVF